MIHPGICSPAPSPVGFNCPNKKKTVQSFLKASSLSSRVLIQPLCSLWIICFWNFSQHTHAPPWKTPLAPFPACFNQLIILKASSSSSQVIGLNQTARQLGAWAWEKSLMRPLVFIYFREIRKKRSHRPGGQSAPRLYNSIIAIISAHVPGPHMWATAGPGPSSSSQNSASPMVVLRFTTLSAQGNPR